MPGQRATRVLRNVHLLNAENDEIGGAWQHGNLTWNQMSEWMQIVYELPLGNYAPFPCIESGDPGNPATLHGERIEVIGNDEVVNAGFYVLLNHEGLPVDIPINPEMPLPRAVSRSLKTDDPRNIQFRDRVRERDERCVISGEEPELGEYLDLEAAHIFPLAHLDLWYSGSWSQQITDDRVIGDSKIHTIQNGLLLRSDVHRRFDKYSFAIDPDNDFRVFNFARSGKNLDGVVMFRNVNVAEKYQPLRALLKWHFRNAVLLNMKERAGYPAWDEDIYGDGCDQIAAIASSEQPKVRFETMLGDRLNAYIS